MRPTLLPNELTSREKYAFWNYKLDIRQKYKNQAVAKFSLECVFEELQQNSL